MVCLDADDAGKEAMGKIYRTIERIRRFCIKLLETDATSKTKSTIVTVVKSWLEQTVELVEAGVRDSPLVRDIHPLAA